MENISVKELKERLEAGENIHLLDVREPDENAEFNIGGTLIPLGRIHSMQFDEIEDLTNEEIVIYCRSGNRSLQACMFLEMTGFKNVKNLAGGLVEWKTLS
ncbi:MAG TPA: rhodanese-like domain-containing protein [Flavitalea sp.]|nr:rhodanese-like domain-containing protein [Flavitalea sp.]